MNKSCYKPPDSLSLDFLTLSLTMMLRQLQEVGSEGTVAEPPYPVVTLGDHMPRLRETRGKAHWKPPPGERPQCGEKL